MEKPTPLTKQHSAQVSIQHLSPDHYHTLIQAITNVLSTQLAELTLAELCDGLPLWSTVRDMRGGQLLIYSHPLSKHDSLCDGALEKARQFRDAFDPTSLSFHPYVIQAYQDALPRTQPFNTRLIELVALSIHQVGILLFRNGHKLHDGDIDSVVLWEDPEKWEQYGNRWIEKVRYDPWPTLFFHPDFTSHEYYPNGLAEIVGYWTEDRMLGGVVLFDKGDSGLESKDIYFQSGRQDTTFRTWRLLDTQVDALAEFLLADQPPATSPLPVLATGENLHRYDPWQARPNHVYRNEWELSLPPVPVPDPRHERDVVTVCDYPHLEEAYKKMTAHAEGLPYHESNETVEIPPASRQDVAPDPDGLWAPGDGFEDESVAEIEEEGDPDDGSDGADSLIALVRRHTQGLAAEERGDITGSEVQARPEDQAKEAPGLELDIHEPSEDQPHTEEPATVEIPVNQTEHVGSSTTADAVATPRNENEVVNASGSPVVRPGEAQTDQGLLKSARPVTGVLGKRKAEE